jgi:iron complex outermembrane recepter protein
MNRLMMRSSMAALTIALLSGGSARAQEADGARLEEIVVTAERRAENLQDTPISVVSLSETMLESRNVNNVQELQNFLPNVSIGGSIPAGGSAPDFSIRGVGQTSARASNERGVGLYIDDIYYPRATGSLLSLGDVQRVEVLRGPQGTLFGRNNTGGAIRYFRNPPSDKLEFEGKVTVGSNERRDLSLLANIPLGEKAAFRGQLATFNKEGFVDVIGTNRKLGDQEELGVRAALRFEPTDNITIDLSAAYSRSENSGDPTVVFGTGNAGPSVAPYSLFLTRQGQAPVTFNDPRWVSPDGRSVYSRCILDRVPLVAANFGPSPAQLSGAVAPGTFCDEFREGESVFLTASLEWRLSDNLTFRSLSGFNDGEDNDEGDYGLFGASTNRVRNTMRSFSQEFQLTGAYERLDWVAGLYYFNETPTELIVNRQLAIVAGVPSCCTGFDRLVDLDTTSVALFAQATYDITDRLSLTAGLRHTWDEKSAVITKTGSYAPFIAIPDRTQSASDEWQALDGRLTVDYKWTDNVMTYATLSRGFKSGGFNGEIALVNGRATVEPFDPEYVTNYEVGVRSELFDRRLRANVTAFFMQFEDTVIQNVEFVGGSVQTRFLNAGAADITGFEGEFVLAVAEGLSLAANIGHTSLEYQSLGVDSPLFFPNSCAPPRTLERCQAQTLARTPEWTYTLGVDYRRPMFDGDLHFSLNYAYKDEQFSGNSTSNSIVLDDYAIANVRLQFNSSSFWQVAVFGSNITDEDYYTAGIDGRAANSPLGSLSKSVGSPREWGLTFTAKY